MMVNEKLKAIRHFNSIFPKKESSSKNKNICSIKPIIFNFPNDINSRDIFFQMINSAKNDNFINYYKLLSKREINKRSSVLKLMKQFILSKKINYRMIYLTIFFFDVLIKRNKENFSIEELGIGSLLLVIKFFYEKHNNINNKMFKFFNNKQYSNDELSLLEIKCLKMINYQFNVIQPIFFIDLFFLNGIVFSIDNIKNEDVSKVYNYTLKLLEYFMGINNNYIKYHPLIFCCVIIAICRQKYNLEKWPEILEKTFQINFNDFDEIYTLFNSYCKDVKINENEQKLKKYKSMSSEKIFSNKSENEFQNSIKRLEKKNDQKKIKENNKNIEYKSPEKISNIIGIKSPFIFKSPNSEKKINNCSNLIPFNKNLLLSENPQQSIDENNNIKKEKSEKFIKNISKDNFGGLFRKKSRNLKINHPILNEELVIKKKDKNKLEINIFISDSGLNNNIQQNISNHNSIISPSILKEDERNKRIMSIEHYKRFNISMNNKIPNELIERRVKNLSTIVNHLYSNLNNNIL